MGEIKDWPCRVLASTMVWMCPPEMRALKCGEPLYQGWEDGDGTQFRCWKVRSFGSDQASEWGSHDWVPMGLHKQGLRLTETDTPILHFCSHGMPQPSVGSPQARPSPDVNTWTWDLLAMSWKNSSKWCRLKCFLLLAAEQTETARMQDKGTFTLCW